jgi:hypothetical protein
MWSAKKEEENFCSTFLWVKKFQQQLLLNKYIMTALEMMISIVK